MTGHGDGDGDGNERQLCQPNHIPDPFPQKGTEPDARQIAPIIPPVKKIQNLKGWLTLYLDSPLSLSQESAFSTLRYYKLYHPLLQLSTYLYYLQPNHQRQNVYESNLRHMQYVNT